MCACCAPAQDNRFRSKASQLWPWGAFPEGSLESVEQRRYRLGVRTPDSQSGNPGSIPGTATSTLFHFHSSVDKAREEGISTRGAVGRVGRHVFPTGSSSTGTSLECRR